MAFLEVTGESLVVREMNGIYNLDKQKKSFIKENFNINTINAFLLIICS